jgi:hypothetical protein
MGHQRALEILLQLLEFHSDLALEKRLSKMKVTGLVGHKRALEILLQL